MPLTLPQVHVLPFPQVHGPITSWGFRVDAGNRSFCYSTDLNDVTPELEVAVRECDLWIVDALRRRPHPTHSYLDRTLEWIRRLQPKEAILTHMDNSMDYGTLLAELPDGVVPGYDMLTREL